MALNINELSLSQIGNEPAAHPVELPDSPRSSRSQSVVSGASSTLSAFVRSRTAAGGLYESAVGGAHTIAETMQRSTGNITSSLLEMSDRLKEVAQQSTTRRIIITAPDINDPQFVFAARLDDQKIIKLLQISAINESDIQTYYNLLHAAQDMFTKKKFAQQMAFRKKELSLTSQDICCDLSYITMHDRIDDILLVLKYTVVKDETRLLISAAFTHDSFVGGREANRTLAYIGDAAARLLLGVEAHQAHKTVSALDDSHQLTQSNAAWALLMHNLGLQKFVRIKGTSRESKAILGTVFEALLGAIYFDGGVSALQTLNEHVKWLAEFTPSTPRSSVHA